MLCAPKMEARAEAAGSCGVVVRIRWRDEQQIRLARPEYVVEDRVQPIQRLEILPQVSWELLAARQVVKPRDALAPRQGGSRQHAEFPQPELDEFIFVDQVSPLDMSEGRDDSSWKCCAFDGAQG